jgi:hemerythrin-like metal-binding protein
MAFVVWDELYATGIESIDVQHKRFVSLLNLMIEALMQKKGDEQLSYVIDEMEKYAGYHFENEEELMEKADYPDLEEHRMYHDAFTTKVEDYRHKHDVHDEALTGEITIFLTNWLNEHLSIVDQKYVPYLKKAEID